MTWKNLNYNFSQTALSISTFAIFSLEIFEQNGNFYKMQFLWSNSCFLVTQEIRSLHITFTFFLPWIL